MSFRLSASRARRAVFPGRWIGVLLLFGWGGPAAGQTNTIGLILNTTNASPGYTLFSTLNYTNSYLIDNDGQVVNVWRSQYDPGNSEYLRENGNLVRSADPGSTNFVTGGDSGAVQEFDWDGNLLWEFHYVDTTHRGHHDIALLPNSNVLMIAWELKTSNEAVAAGRDPSLIMQGELWPETIVEIEPVGTNGGNIVWEWHVWDHLIQDFDSNQANFGVVADHPELIDINAVRDGRADWLHSNAIDYSETLDQIILSTPFLSELWVIDHNTTTAEAAGHTGGARGKGGDFLYRWGNPQIYDSGTNQMLYFQHNTQWIRPGLPGEGHILVYNNGQGRPEGEFSTVVEIVPPVDANGFYANPAPGTAFGPATQLWVFAADPPEDLYSAGLSGANRQPNGNTLICEGVPGTFWEVTTDSNLVWQYINPVNGNTGPMEQGTPPSNNRAFRAVRYAPDFPGFAGRDLSPKGTLELDPNGEFRFVSIERSDSEAQVRWSSVPDAAYQVWFAESLDGPTNVWTNVTTTVAMGTLTTLTDTNPARLNQTPGFYQVTEE